MRKTYKPIRPQSNKKPKSLYDLGFFDSREKRKITRKLKPLGISEHRPLILVGHAGFLQLRKEVVLLASNRLTISKPHHVICGWREEHTEGAKNYCLGIMDERVTVAGEYYRCRKHPKEHRTLK